MKLYVGRHSFAGAFSNDPKIERERPLKPLGVEMANAAADGMIESDEIPNVIFTSPLERAKQTADIYGKRMRVPVNVIDDLAPQRPLEDRILELMGHKEIKRVMLVGHHDNTTPAFTNFKSDETWDPLKMAEVRRLRIDRKSGEWSTRWRQLPSELGYRDIS